MKVQLIQPWTSFYLYIVIVCVQPLWSQRQNTLAFGRIDDSRCHCMEYWECVTGGGKPTSYCGPSENQVCCFIPTNAKPVGILPRPTPHKRSQCGRKGSTTSGSAEDGHSEFGEWPWQAAILEKHNALYICGASLLDEHWLLTAAHCVQSYLDQISAIKIRLGEFDMSKTDERYPYEERELSQIIIHPNFINTTLLNDIALLHLSQKVTKRPHIDIVCMPTMDIDDKLHGQQRCVITGWGRIAESSDNSPTLKEIPVPMWNSSACQEALKSQFGPTFALPQTAICAGAENRDACHGDGGGPLVCERNGRWEQVGIISYGIGCGQPNLPGVYTRVLVYSAWIKQAVRSNS